MTLDGRDLRDYDVESFRTLLGIVEQDVFLFDGTIAQNIAYARRDATPGEIRAAAAAANATEFIDRMTHGMQTVIGERGVRLSGGQRQRLAIARAILADPKLLILDEATSNLDTDSERLIQQSLATLMRGRTSFVIAHRLSTIARADLIVVVENGRISQTGTHSELMSQGGKYRAMVEQQIHMTLGNINSASAIDVDFARRHRRRAGWLDHRNGGKAQAVQIPHGCRQVQILSPRLFPETSPLARTSKGFSLRGRELQLQDRVQNARREGLTFQRS